MPEAPNGSVATAMAGGRRTDVRSPHSREVPDEIDGPHLRLLRMAKFGALDRWRSVRRPASASPGARRMGSSTIVKRRSFDLVGLVPHRHGCCRCPSAPPPGSGRKNGQRVHPSSAGVPMATKYAAAPHDDPLTAAHAYRRSPSVYLKPRTRKLNWRLMLSGATTVYCRCSASVRLKEWQNLYQWHFFTHQFWDMTLCHNSCDS